MTGIFEKSIKTKRAAIETHRLLQYAWDNSKFSGREIFFSKLVKIFNNRWRCRRFEGSGVDWPPYSPDMNPCDFFLWGHLKDQVYRHNPETIEQLKQYISSACEAIPPDTFTKVSGNFVQILRHIIAAHGGYGEDIVV